MSCHSSNCVCDLNALQQDCCCASLINGQASAEKPVELMRSRYVAFATGEVDYLYSTSSLNLKKQLTIQDLQDSCDNTTFVGLEVLEYEKDLVEFKASYLVGDIFSCIHETSKFIYEDTGWKYDSGIMHASPEIRIKRNDLCPCGSNKKFKKCHMK